MGREKRSTDARARNALVAVSSVFLLTGCWSSVDSDCPFTDHCEGRRIHTCTGGDEPGQAYKTRYSDCGEGRTCVETTAGYGGPECVSEPLTPCQHSTCDGNTRVLCGRSGNLTGGVEDCEASGRICGESSSDSACVIAEAPCPAGKSKFCSADHTFYYTGCDKGFGLALDTVSCAAPCGVSVCLDSGNAATCGDSPVIACGTRSTICSADGKRSLFCSPAGGYYFCSRDCSEAGQRCVSSTGECGYDISCQALEYSKCSPDGKSVYICNVAGGYVSSISACPAGKACVANRYDNGSVTAFCR